MDMMNVVDMVIVSAIIAAMEVIKGFDEERKLKRLYPLFVALLGIAAAVFKANPLNWQTLGYHMMVYVAVPSYVFKFGKTTILGK